MPFGVHLHHQEEICPIFLFGRCNVEKINESDIITNRSEVPTIWYKDANEKEHRYFVDIYVPSQNRCVEIKSTWTMEKKRDCIFEKQQAVKDAGYKCEIWVFNGKGEKVECYL